MTDYKEIFSVVDAAKEIWQDKAADKNAYATEQARHIFAHILPTVLDRFVRKNADYGDTAGFLGVPGQFADINRKFWKLKRALWDGDELIGESPDEILTDFIGHCLITLYFLDKSRNSTEGSGEVLVDGIPHEPAPDGPGVKWIPKETGGNRR